MLNDHCRLQLSRYIQIFIFGVTFTLSFVSPAQAIVVGNKDWMQVATISSITPNELYLIFSGSHGECVIGNCMLGSINMTGYVWASFDDVLDLVNTLTDFAIPHRADITTYGNTNSADTIFQIFSPTIEINGVRIIEGIFRAYTYPSLDNGSITIYDYNDGTTIDKASVNFTYDRYVSYSNVGGWFYKPLQVPEPGTLSLFISGIIGLLFVSRKSI
jgi:hypothetical protein